MIDRSYGDLERELADWLEANASTMTTALHSAIEDVPARHEQLGRRRWLDGPRLQLVAATVVASATLVAVVMLGSDALDDLRRAIANRGSPGNGVAEVDDVADAMVVDTVPFEWTDDLAGATTEPGEAFGCANSTAADRSVWFEWTAPDTGTMRVTIGAGGRSEPVSTTNAAVFGPFEEPPSGVPHVDGLRWCVNGVGEEYTLSEAVDGGRTYLIQLSAVSTSETRASIGIDFDRRAP